MLRVLYLDTIVLRAGTLENLKKKTKYHLFVLILKASTTVDSQSFQTTLSWGLTYQTKTRVKCRDL